MPCRAATRSTGYQNKRYTPSMPCTEKRHRCSEYTAGEITVNLNDQQDNDCMHYGRFGLKLFSFLLLSVQKFSASSRFRISLEAVLYDLHENDIPGVYKQNKYYAIKDLLSLCIID